MTKLLLTLFAKDHQTKKGRAAVGRLSGTVGIICNVLLFAAKLVMGILSGSVSLTADAMNNLMDATGSVVTLFGFKLAEKPADEDHPYGHARYEYLSGLAVAALILVIGVDLAKESVGKILSPTPVEFSWALVAVLVLSIGVKLWLSLFNGKLGRLIDSSALHATSCDSRNDCIATGAVLLSAVIEKLSGLQVDGWFGLFVAGFILYSGINLARETISPLLGESGNPQLYEDIAKSLCAEEKVLGYHDLMVHDYGPGQRFASVHVEMDQAENPMDCHDLIDNLERQCQQALGVHLVIHYDPVVTGDAQLDQVKNRVEAVLKGIDSRISIHDFRMVPGHGHKNLIFDVALPQRLQGEREAIQAALEAALNDLGEGIYHTVITFEMAEFNG